jgi:hypothetical protein
MDDLEVRDLFAMLAMNGLIHHFDFDTFSDDPKRLAVWSYDAADAMIEAREDKKIGLPSIKRRRK